jgi:hypothetical protein
MVAGLELRFANALRERINEAQADYINELDDIDLARADALALFAEARMKYATLENVLFMMDEINEDMGDN